MERDAILGELVETVVIVLNRKASTGEITEAVNRLWQRHKAYDNKKFLMSSVMDVMRLSESRLQIEDCGGRGISWYPRCSDTTCDCKK
jgi:hypothetical protein